MGADGIAISADGSRLYYCPLVSRRLYSVAIDALVERALDEQSVAATVIDEGDKGSGADGLESDAAGYIYATNYEHQAILRRRADGAWETVAHDPRLMWTDTMSITTDGYLYVTANQLHRQAKYQKGKTCVGSPTHFSAFASTLNLYCCVEPESATSPETLRLNLSLEVNPKIFE